MLKDKSILISVNRPGSFLLRCEMLKLCKWREKSFVESIALVCHFLTILRSLEKKKKTVLLRGMIIRKITKMGSNDNVDSKVYYTVISKWIN